MENISEKYNLLITRVLAGEATDNEKKELQAWLESSANHLEFFKEYQKIWQTSPAQAPEITINKKLAWERINQKIDAYEQQSDESHNKIIPLNTSFKHRAYLLSGIAAMLIIISGVFFMIFQNQKNQLLSYENVQPTTTDSILLNDGTTVFFNGKATLNYPAEFSKDQRRVSLEGNAFFDVNTYDQYPFIIELEGARVIVPGTSFNILQDHNTGNIELAVLSGKVILETESGESITLSADQKVTWKPSSQAFTREPIDNYNFMAWKTGKLEFVETPLTDVLSDISKAYYIDIKWASEIEDQKLTARFINEKPEDIFNSLEILFDVTIEKEHNTYVVAH